MIHSEQVKTLLWSVLGLAGIITFWRGIWEGASYIPIIDSLWISLFLGLIMMAITAFMFQNQPLQSSEKIIRSLQNHPQKQEFHLKYRDNLINKEVAIPAHHIKKVQKGFVTIEDKDTGMDYFLPIERIVETTFQGKTHWKKAKKAEEAA